MFDVVNIRLVGKVTDVLGCVDELAPLPEVCRYTFHLRQGIVIEN
jgi:hypothetical protein